MRLPETCSLFVLAFWCWMGSSQQPLAVSPTLARSEGRDAVSSIVYTRLYLTGIREPAPTAFEIASPTLTVQCTQHPNGRFFFELFVNFGGVTDTTYYPPWRRTAESGLFPPPTLKQPVTLEFLGYTHVKPVRRQFEFVAEPAGQLRYNSPSLLSSNMEEIAFYFQYLKALPTLRLSYTDHTATFQTEALLAQIRKEPLCQASALLPTR